MKAKASRRNQFRQDFQSKLPTHIGQPYIMNTFKAPVTFVAFFPARRHELKDGSIVHGSELRLLRYSNSMKPAKMLAAILGVREQPADIVLLALQDEGTTRAELEPYKALIKDMYREAVSP